MTHVGIDPDIGKTSLVVLSGRGEIELVFLSKLPASPGRTARDAVVLQMLQLAEAIGGIRIPPGCCIALEGQRYLGGRSQANPQDLIHLGQIGAFVLGLVSGGASRRIRLPFPQEWKGSQSKQAHHERICSQLGLEYEILPPPSRTIVPILDPSTIIEVAGKTAGGKPQKLNPGDWTDIMDSLGLAQWSRTASEKSDRRKICLESARVRGSRSGG